MSGQALKNASGAAYPLLPAQLAANNSGLRRGEPSGEIYCPRKWSRIAIMRCGEYQDRDGCGAGCASKAADEDVARARAQTNKVDGVGWGTYVCARCREAKRFTRSELCMRCGNIESNKLNHRGRGL